MLTIYLENGSQNKLRMTEVFSPVRGEELLNKLINDFGIESDNFFLKNNGCLVGLNTIIHSGDVSLEPKLCGGKGGFGSMLRAIGAQIEKTTNREACRDLSGRRLRDINEEKRLKAWIDKQSQREEEAVERKKKKLQKLCAVPKHEFKDKSYEEQRSSLTERVENAVEVGFAAAATTSAIKRTAAQDAKTNPRKKVKTILDDDIDSDDLDSSDSEDEKEPKKKDNDTESKSVSDNSSDVASTGPGSSNEDDTSKPASESQEVHSEVSSTSR